MKLNRRGFLGSLAAAGALMGLDPEKLLWRPETKKIFIPGIVPENMQFLWVNQFSPEVINQFAWSSIFPEGYERMVSTARHQTHAVISDRPLALGEKLWKSSDGFSVYSEPRMDCKAFGVVASGRAETWLRVPIGDRSFRMVPSL